MKASQETKTESEKGLANRFAAQKKHTNKRSPAQVEADRLQIEKWVLRSMRQDDMAVELAKIRDYKITRQQISYDIGVVKSKWQKETRESAAGRLNKMLAEIDEQIDEAWRAWEKSKLDAEKETVETSKEGTKKRRERQGQYGDPRFLDTLCKLREQRIKLLGMEPARKTEISGTPGGEAIKFTVQVTGEEIP